MINKLWYKRVDRNYDGSIGYDYANYRNSIFKYIKLYCSNVFETPEDITPDNLIIFTKIILRQYQMYNICIFALNGLMECIEIYFDEAYGIKLYPIHGHIYPRSDRRSLVQMVMNECTLWVRDIMPEDINFIIECLECPEDEIINMEDKLNKYFEQFDLSKRSIEEEPRRWEAIRKERIEALEKGEPLPIKPMSITLDPCYKEKSN